MGRKRTSPKPKRDRRIQVMIDADTAEAIERYANQSDRTISDFTYRLLRHALGISHQADLFPPK